MPVVIAVAGLWFTAQQDQRQRDIESSRAKLERELEEQRAQDDALQAYLDQMSTLMLGKDLSDDRVQTLMRARTLTVLASMDPSRKTQVMRFLAEANSVQRVEKRGPLISLEDADLEGADLSFADLSNAELIDADLSGAELLGATGISKEELELRTASLQGAIMPDGQIYGGEYVTDEFEPALSLSVSEGWRVAGWEISHSLHIEGPEGGQLIFTSPLHIFDPSKLSELKEGPAPENADEWTFWFQ